MEYLGMWILYSHKYFIKHKHIISEECYVYVKEMKFHFHLFLLTLIVYCLYYLFSETQKKNSCSVLQELPSSSSLQRQNWQHFHEIFSQNETHGVVKFSQFKFSKKKNITSINLLLMRKGTHKFTVSSKTNCTFFFVKSISRKKLLYSF